MKIIDFLLFTLCIVLLSYNFHFLWLLYDALALIGVLYCFQYLKVSLSFYGYAALLSLYLVFACISNGAHFISFVSIWDNIKHLFVAGMIFSIIQKQEFHRLWGYRQILQKIVSFFFFVNFFITLIQYQSGLHFDDVAGIFGDGGTHALGVLILVNFAITLWNQKNLLYTGLIFIMSIMIIYISEIAAILPLMVILSIFIRPKMGILLIILFILILLLNSDVRDFAALVVRRIILMVDYGQIDITRMPYHRAGIMLYAWLVGGFFGVGPGAFSEIYGLSGWAVASAANYQINISAATQNIAEIGVIGLILLTLTYIILLTSFFSKWRNKLFVGSYFTLFIFYNRILMDERIMLLVMLLFIFIKIEELKNQYEIKVSTAT